MSLRSTIVFFKEGNLMIRFLGCEELRQMVLMVFIFSLSAEEVAFLDDRALHFTVDYHALDYQLTCR